MIGEGTYTLAEVSRFTEVHPSTVRTWFKGRPDGTGRGSVFRSDYPPVGSDYAVSFLDMIDALKKHQIIAGIDITDEIHSEQERKEERLGKYAESGEMVMEFVPTAAFKKFILTNNDSKTVNFEIYTMVDTNTPASSDDPRTDFDTVFYILEIMFDSTNEINLEGLASGFKSDYRNFLEDVEKILDSRVMVDFTKK